MIWLLILISAHHHSGESGRKKGFPQDTLAQGKTYELVTHMIELQNATHSHPCFSFPCSAFTLGHLFLHNGQLLEAFMYEACERRCGKDSFIFCRSWGM
jgi:hypothetical protein